jgi:hypothetical protein
LVTGTLGDEPAERGEFQVWDAATGMAMGAPAEAKDGLFVPIFDHTDLLRWPLVWTHFPEPISRSITKSENREQDDYA